MYRNYLNQDVHVCIPLFKWRRKHIQKTEQWKIDSFLIVITNVNDILKLGMAFYIVYCKEKCIFETDGMAF